MLYREWPADTNLERGCRGLLQDIAPAFAGRNWGNQR